MPDGAPSLGEAGAACFHFGSCQHSHASSYVLGHNTGAASIACFECKLARNLALEVSLRLPVPQLRMSSHTLGLKLVLQQGLCRGRAKGVGAARCALCVTTQADCRYTYVLGHNTGFKTHARSDTMGSPIRHLGAQGIMLNILN